MNQPITFTPPVNAIISVQPLTVAVPGRDAADVPAQLANLSPGTTVQGFVINRDAQSNPILRTAQGDVLVQSDVFIKTGSEVAFRIDATQTAGRARILTIDGLTPEDYVSQSGRPITQDTVSASGIPTTNAAGLGQPTTQSQATFEAIVLSPATALPNAKGDAPIPAALAQLQPGQKLRVLIQSLTLPAASPVSVAQLAAPAGLEQLLPPSPQPQHSGTTPSTPTSASVATATPTPTAAITPSSPEVASANAGPVLPTASGAAFTGNVTPSGAPPAGSVANNTPAVAGSPASPPPPAAAQATTFNPALIAQEQSNTPARPGQTVPAQANNAPSPATSAAAPLTRAGSPQPVTYAPTPIPSAAAAPASTAALPAAQPVGVSVTATVIGHEGDGATVLQTPVATLKLYTSQPLPYGSQLAIVAEPESATPATQLPAGDPQTTLLKKVNDDLQSVTNTLAGLAHADIPGVQPLALHVPQPDSRLASSLLFFLAAIKTADPRDWLGGRALERLRQAAPDLVAKLSTDLAQLNPLSAQQPGTPWSSTLLPILHQQQLQPAMLYFQHDEGGNQSSEPGKSGVSGQRFIVEVELSQLGGLQFDGFVRHHENRRQLDLVIRSHRALPDDVMQGIRATFVNALEVTGLQGQAIFQQGSQYFFRPRAEMRAAVATPPNTILA